MGQPTIRGLRITVVFVLKLMASGMTHAEILDAYPELEEDDLQQAIEYATWLASEYDYQLKIKASGFSEQDFIEALNEIPAVRPEDIDELNAQEVKIR